MSSMFTSLLPFLAALQRKQGLPQDEDDSNPPADQGDGSSDAAWADPASARGNGGPSTAAWADPLSAQGASAQGNGGPQNASGQPSQSTPSGPPTQPGS